MTGDLEETICELPRIEAGDIEADCLPLTVTDVPEVNCSCCTKCCNDNGQCASTVESGSMRRCVGLIDAVEAAGNLTCTCDEFSDGGPPNPAGQSPSVDLRCVWQDEQCTSCNESGGICATNLVIGGIFYEDTDKNLVGASGYTEFQYISGQSETIYFEYGSSTFTGRWCQFAVDGQRCASCSYALCNDNSNAHVIDCSNIMLNGTVPTTYNGCRATGNDLGVFDAIYVYENKLDACTLELGGLED